MKKTFSIALILCAAIQSFAQNIYYISNATGSAYSISNAFSFANSNFSALNTNLGAFKTTSNPTNQFATDTLYTNSLGSIIVGTAVLDADSAGDADITLLVTNSGVEYRLPMRISAGALPAMFIPFSYPLTTNSIFIFRSTMGTGAAGYITNVVNWTK